MDDEVCAYAVGLGCRQLRCAMLRNKATYLEEPHVDLLLFHIAIVHFRGGRVRVVVICADIGTRL